MHVSDVCAAAPCVCLQIRLQLVIYLQIRSKMEKEVEETVCRFGPKRGEDKFAVMRVARDQGQVEVWIGDADTWHVLKEIDIVLADQELSHLTKVPVVGLHHQPHTQQLQCPLAAAECGRSALSTSSTRWSTRTRQPLRFSKKESSRDHLPTGNVPRSPLPVQEHAPMPICLDTATGCPAMRGGRWRGRRSGPSVLPALAVIAWPAALPTSVPASELRPSPPSPVPQHSRSVTLIRRYFCPIPSRPCPISISTPLLLEQRCPCQRAKGTATAHHQQQSGEHTA